MTAPYRKVYPDASPSQWRCKGKDAEKFVRIMELMNPKIDPMEVCKAEEVAEEDEEDDSYPGILDQHRVRCWVRGKYVGSSANQTSTSVTFNSVHPQK